MAVSEAHKRASNKWNSNRDNIMIRPEKEEGQTIRDAAKDAGQSVQAYVLQAVRERMERESRGTVSGLSAAEPRETVYVGSSPTTPQKKGK